MRERHHGRTTDLGLRLLGLILCATSWLAIRAMVGRHVPHPAALPELAQYARAAAGFACGGAGAVLGLLGHQLFEDIEVSERWRPHPTID